MAPRDAPLPEDLFDSYLSNDELLPPLSGKVVAITGTTTGLGYALARIAVTKKASLVLLLNRKSERSAKSEADLREKYGDDERVTIKSVNCDLMSLGSVRTAAEEVIKEIEPRGGLDVLCLNAGIMAYDDDRTSDGFDVQMQTNVLSHFLLASLLYPSVKVAAEKRGDARIVSHSSSARELPKELEGRYFEKCEPGTLGGNGAWMISQLALGRGGPWTRYGQTKLANACFAMALHNKLKDAGITDVKSLGAEPGYSVTPLQETKHFGGSLMSKLDSMVPKQSASDGCLSAAMACFGLDARSGDFYAPEKGMVGKPIKTVSGGERQNKKSDKNTCDSEQQKLVWEACESALGLDFVV